MKIWQEELVPAARDTISIINYFLQILESYPDIQIGFLPNKDNSIISRELSAMRDNMKKQIGDKAMMAWVLAQASLNRIDAQHLKGGIDLNTDEMDFKSGGTVDPAMMQNMLKINPDDVIGVVPVNIIITPIKNVNMLLGLADDGEGALLESQQLPDTSLTAVLKENG